MDDEVENVEIGRELGLLGSDKEDLDTNDKEETVFVVRIVVEADIEDEKVMDADPPVLGLFVIEAVVGARLKGVVLASVSVGSDDVESGESVLLSINELLDGTLLWLALPVSLGTTSFCVVMRSGL